jgi:hypothetical protein
MRTPDFTQRSLLITHHFSLITIWCISIANTAINHLHYPPIRLLAHQLGTILKLQQNCTKIDLEWVRNTLGTPLEHLEQCNSP